MRSAAGRRVSVHVHYRLARGAYTGDYDFWTLVVEHPVLASMTAALLYDMTKLLARKAITLLKGATTRARRVDLMIPFKKESWVVVRVICTPRPGDDAEGIPSESEVHQALTAATSPLQNASEEEPQKPVAVTAELHVRTGPVQLQVHTTVGRRQWPAVEEQVATARSEKPTLLQENDAKEAIQGLGKKRRMTREEKKEPGVEKGKGNKKHGKKRKKKQ